MEYHVSKNGNDINCGSITEPFLTISKAASLADEGDRIVVHEGEYRECVRVDKGAKGENRRIVYTVADGEKVVIKGSEEINNWELVSGSLYKASVSNEFFGDYNPYAQNINGDWFHNPGYLLHTGQVYINGEALRETPSLAEMKEGHWYCTVNDSTTEIYADFGKLDPNENLIEINVRECCFKGARAGVNNVTVSGFEMCHGATKWSPPTSEQSGIITANWCKGWVIENNHIHDSRCNGISIGKNKTGGDNPYTNIREKGGHIYQLESVFEGIRGGWTKELVGSHIVRNNTIHHCGQTGIVGHMGSAFSEIYGNHIYEIANTDEFYGDEIAGIKLHAAIDTYIHHNNIHDCLRGMWLDWQAQGTRVSSNLFFNNNKGEDFFVEVSHGPFLADNNVFLSDRSIQICSQGNAFVHNLIGGSVTVFATTRNTPYHFPHSTEIKGFYTMLNGDDQYINNIFAPIKKNAEWYYGTNFYNDYNPSYEAYMKERFERAECGRMKGIMLPVNITGNRYFGGSTPFEKEDSCIVSDSVFSISLKEEDGKYYLEADVPEADFRSATEQVNTNILGKALMSGAVFENPDGSEISIDKDYFGNERSNKPAVGPFEHIKSGKNKILIW